MVVVPLLLQGYHGQAGGYRHSSTDSAGLEQHPPHPPMEPKLEQGPEHGGQAKEPGYPPDPQYLAGFPQYYGGGGGYANPAPYSYPRYWFLFLLLTLNINVRTGFLLCPTVDCCSSIPISGTELDWLLRCFPVFIM